MAGKHRKSSRPSSVVARVVAPGGLAAAAVTATSLSTALMTGTTTAVAPVAVDLVALITPANSTSQIFAGTTYYNTNYANEGYGPQQVVPFLLGPQGIADAISAANDDEDGIVVLSSGWGAGQTGTALGILAANGDPALNDIDLVILDNNTNRAGGGFWTTYSIFAPLLLTSAEPTPDDLGIPVLDVAYEYNFNSSAPVDPLNPFSIGNTLAAYVFGYGSEQTAEVPAEAIAEAKDQTSGTVHYHYVVAPDGSFTKEDLPAGTTTTYVTFESDGLPLTRPLRLLPGGAILADALDPTLTQLVNAGYNDGLGEPGNEAIPVDPTVPRPMQPGSSLGNLDNLPGSVQTGLDAGADTAQEDLESPTNFVTKPLGEVGKLPVLGSLVSLPTTTSSTTRLANNSPNKFFPGSNDTAATSATGSAGNATQGQSFADRINDAVNRVTGGLQRDKTADSPDSNDSANDD